MRKVDLQLSLQANLSIMIIQQFEDKCLAHYSYAILSEGKVALVDPERDPQPYFNFARDHHAQIVAVFETHPHADFISSHAEINRKTGASIYASKLLSAGYPHKSFDEGDRLKMGNVEFTARNTPGHSPDSICIVAYENGKTEAVFTGDTLFIGDCGRPDLREKAGALTAKREDLARKMYHSLREKLMPLPDTTKVYPTHGAGSLCGRGLSQENASTIGVEKVSNWSLQEFTEDAFVEELLSNQPFVPKYFTNSVQLNKEGAADFDISVSKVKIQDSVPDQIDPSVTVMDTRSEEEYSKGALRNSINLMLGDKFETWLGSLVAPGESFYLIASDRVSAEALIKRIAKIGYEGQIRAVFVQSEIHGRMLEPLDVNNFREHEDEFTIVDVRNASEVMDGKIFAHAVVIPLPELDERVAEIPTDKPLVVHCAAGYRSAAAVSILENRLNGKVKIFDLGTAVTTF